MKHLLVSSALAFALVAMPSLAQTSSGYPATLAQIQPATVTDPQEFATKAGTAGMFEIQSSQIALSKSQSAQIKAFAQQMIDDHSKAAEALKTAAASQGNITLPTALDAESTAKLQQLQGAEGGDFDKLYVQLQTTAHAEAVALFSGYGQGGVAGPLKDFANQTLPTLQMHYEHVLALPH